MKNTSVKTSTESILGERDSAFRLTSSSELPVMLDTNDPSVPDLFKYYEYPVNSWPVVVNEEKAKELAKLSIRIPKLLKMIPSLYFNNDIKRLADFYYNGNELLTQFSMMCHKKDIDIGCRLDITESQDGFKILEANMGTSIGGWQVQSFESLIRGLHPQLSNPETADCYQVINTQEIYIKFLIDKILDYTSPTKKEINIFITLGNEDNKPQIEANLVFFNALLKKELALRGLTGGAVSGDFSTLDFKGGELLKDGKTIQGVLIWTGYLGDMPPALFRAFMTHKIYFPDNFGTTMYGDKRNLSLLRVLAENGKFSPEDNQMLLNAIPWTAPIEKGNVLFNGQEHDLLTMLKDNKDQFVVKIADGGQGKNVFIGKFSTQKEWEEAIELAQKDEPFIAQEFCDSINISAPDRSNKWAPHKLIWGSFGFGERYGGVWVRMSALETDIGVINSATGAVEAIVYEYTAK